ITPPPHGAAGRAPDPRRPQRRAAAWWSSAIRWPAPGPRGGCAGPAAAGLRGLRRAGRGKAWSSKPPRRPPPSGGEDFNGWSSLRARGPGLMRRATPAAARRRDAPRRYRRCGSSGSRYGPDGRTLWRTLRRSPRLPGGGPRRCRPCSPGLRRRDQRPPTPRSLLVLRHVEDDDPPSAPVAVAAMVDVAAAPLLRDRPRAGIVVMPPLLDDRLSRPRPGVDGDRDGQPLTHAGCDHPVDVRRASRQVIALGAPPRRLGGLLGQVQAGGVHHGQSSKLSRTPRGRRG